MENQQENEDDYFIAKCERVPYGYCIRCGRKDKSLGYDNSMCYKCRLEQKNLVDTPTHKRTRWGDSYEKPKS